ncbi:phosphoesterase [Guyparkeria sp. XI15]|nr:phosphoesterase [Guyparkeria sp. XI15]OAE88354.1 phosphoesterase [Guyparkeria sp. WRN-7]
MSVAPLASSRNDFLICRQRQDDSYRLYRVDPQAAEVFVPMETGGQGSFDHSYGMAQTGGYLLQWSPLCDNDGTPGYRFALRAFDPHAADPLNGTLVQSGFWKKTKFWGHRDYYSDDPDEDRHLDLLPVSSFVFSLIPARGRGTFELWNFDPKPDDPGNADPMPEPYTRQGGFPLIRRGYALIPLGNYVLERLPDGSRFRLWSFDPQQEVPLSLPTVQSGRWDEIDASHELVALGDHVLDWRPEDGRFRLWGFDPQRPEVLIGPVREGSLPEGIGPDARLIGFQSRRPVDSLRAGTPGTLDFMRSKIRHVVYYMLESRSFDNVCGWLYQKGEPNHVIGPAGDFEGASTDDYNWHEGRKVHVSQFKDGQLSDKWDLKALDQDPFHDTTDVLQQMFANPADYWERATPDMGGFVLNNANDQVMETFSPAQLPVLNGLAGEFAVSDRWFSSIPGGTDVNRGFSVTGSAFDRLGTWEGGNAYEYWPKSRHRQSIWKVLWSQGITDWKIYDAVLWKKHVFTYQLYLQGQIPTVDADPSRFIAGLDQFKQDAKDGKLPSFSYLEPIWYAPSDTTSYHPGTDPIPGERALNEIYEAISNGPGWEHTLLVVTFDKNGGVYDHVAPPYARKPWPNDCHDGFAYDLMGPRVPAIMVSPWIREGTVVRADGEVPFDSTSFAATLLDWFGVPRPQWGLGDRMAVAPTFETVFQAAQPRTTTPRFTPPYDKSFPQGS